MLPVNDAVSRFRRDLLIAGMLRGLLLAGAVICILAGPILGFRGGEMILLMVIGAVWMALSVHSVRGARMAADSPALISAGQFEQAESHIDSALRTFSLFRTAKLLNLHHLAQLRHAQRRWRETAVLCQALLEQKLANLPSLARTALLLLCDSLLHLDDLRGTFDAINQLYRYRLSLGESLTLQLMELDYGSRIGAWEPMLSSVGVKVQLAELMPSVSAARAQALLSLAAQKTGRTQLALWLRRRSELLADPSEIAADHPILADMMRQTWSIAPDAKPLPPTP
jgi:hypothetical protein